VRRAVALARRGEARAALRVASDGRSFSVSGGPPVDLGRRAAPRRLLVALVDARRATPGRAVSRDDLIAAGWPGERMMAEAADKRLRTAIWSLRRAGLEEALLTRDDGYLIDPLVAVVVE
jgi:DNA-binding SARP family transcriptional activator